MIFTNEKIGELHESAMLIAEDAFIYNRKGKLQDTDKAKTLFKNAYQKERKAAMLLVEDFSDEFNRALLFKSAARLAFNAGMSKEAAAMTNLGLAGNPPSPLFEQLYQIKLDIEDQKADREVSASNESVAQILGIFRKLPTNVRSQVVDFIQFLAAKYLNTKH